jgi:hypothetical protein
MPQTDTIFRGFERYDFTRIKAVKDAFCAVEVLAASIKGRDFHAVQRKLTAVK